MDIALTFFNNHSATHKTERVVDLVKFAAEIAITSAPSKAALPWVKMAQFGDARSPHGSLRTDYNLVSISGLEADYDGETVSFEEAVDIAEKMPLQCVVYTSPSHTPEKPRWRVLAPISEALPPGRRTQLMNRLNGLFRGIFTVESWTLSQSYYYGSVNHHPAHLVRFIDGGFLDEFDELDLIAIGKPHSTTSPDGEKTVAGLDEQALLEHIHSGTAYHTAATRIAGLWARNGVAYLAARQRLVAAFDCVPAPIRDRRWRDRRAEIDRILQAIYGKEAGKTDTQEAALAGWEASLPPPPGDSLGNGHHTTGTGTPGSQPVFGALAPEFSHEQLSLAYVSRHSDELRYVTAWGRWQHWTAAYWEHENTLLALDFSRAVCRDYANSCSNDKLARDLASGRTVNAVHGLVRADRRFAAVTEQWDADRWALNTPGGTVDLRGGKLRPHRREDYITKVTAVTPGGDCSLWLEFLDVIMSKDEALISYLQRVAGYSLTGITREHALFFGYGTGGNGKGVFLGALNGILKDYACVSPMETFIESKGDRHPTELAYLRGARLVTAQETERGRRWAETKIKALTGGDPISARFMRQDFFTFMPQFKLFIAGNYKPGLRGVNEAIRRRFNLIPFLVTIPEKDRDPQLDEKLKAEWPGILQWMIEGCLTWQKGGLQPPPAVVKATAAYLAEQDTLELWLEEKCAVDPIYSATVADLFDLWKEWTAANGEYTGSKKRLSQALEDRGFERMRIEPGSMRGFQGIALVVTPV